MLKLTSLIIIILISKALPQEIINKPCQNDYGLNKLNGYCNKINDCLGGAFISKTCDSLVCCVNDSSSSCNNNILSKSIFLKIAGDSPRNNWLYSHFCDSLVYAQISTDSYRLAAYLSQQIGETDSFKSIESKSAEKDNDLNIGNNQTGDGSIYRGRGAILLRGKENYKLAPTNLGVNFLKEPEKAALPSYAFKLGAWFWTSNAYVVKSKNKAQKESLNVLSDGTFFNYTLLTYSLTNSLESLKLRTNINEMILNEINALNLKRLQNEIECELYDPSSNQIEIGYSVPICLNNLKRPFCGCEGYFEEKSCPFGFNFLDKCRSSDLIKCCIEKFKSSIDLAILVDSSGSLGVSNFNLVRIFVSSIISKLKIGNNNTRVSIINFSSLPYVLIDFSVDTSTDIILKVIQNMTYMQGGTRTDLALNIANDKVFNETKGMRPIKDGVPKVIMVITDGMSNEPNLTIIESNKIKKRDINVISVGIKGATINELLEMSSNPHYAFFVNDFNNLSKIVTDLTRSIFLQPALVLIKTEIETYVEQNEYKYFKISLISQNQSYVYENKTYLKEFTIEFTKLCGESQLFYSFDYENPKSDSDYIKNENSGENDANFIDKPLKLKKVVLFKEIKQKYYPIKNLNQKEYIYFSLKGLDKINRFKIYVHEEYISNDDEINSDNTTSIVLIVVFSIITLVLMCVSVFLIIKKYKKVSVFPKATANS